MQLGEEEEVRRGVLGVGRKLRDRGWWVVGGFFETRETGKARNKVGLRVRTRVLQDTRDSV